MAIDFPLYFLAILGFLWRSIHHGGHGAAYAATKFGMNSRKGAKTQRKRNPIFRTSRPFDAAQDMLGVLATWREEYPNPRISDFCKICANRENFPAQ
jgi:hypothetical protein